MLFSRTIILALPAVAYAQDQIPLLDTLKGYFNKAQSFVASAAPSIPPVADAGAAKVANAVVSPLTFENWRSVLTPNAAAGISDEPEPWLIHITGGNKTCYGLCENATLSWNQAVAQLTAKPGHPNFAEIDCEPFNGQLLCNSWAVTPPSVVYALLPKPLADQSKPATELHYIRLDRTEVSPANITRLYTQEEYKEYPAYTGVYHPFDGLLHQYGLDLPVTYIITGFAALPSWVPMIAFSFISRSFMGRRMNRGAPPGTAPAGGAAAPQ